MTERDRETETETETETDDLDFGMFALPGARTKPAVPECDKLEKSFHNANWHARELGDLE